jgi:hypothetical protein
MKYAVYGTFLIVFKAETIASCNITTASRVNLESLDFN